jgi:hypothetical protein
MNFTSAVTHSHGWKRIKIATGTTFPITWRRIKGRYVALAAGVAIAVAAAIGVVAWQADSGGGNGPAPVAGSDTLGQTAQGTSLIYIVGSEAQRDSLLVDAAEQAHLLVSSGQQPGQVSAIVAPLGVPDAELLVATMLGEMNSGALVTTQIVDLR